MAQNSSSSSSSSSSRFKLDLTSDWPSYRTPIRNVWFSKQMNCQRWELQKLRWWGFFKPLQWIKNVSGCILWSGPQISGFSCAPELVQTLKMTCYFRLSGHLRFGWSHCSSSVSGYLILCSFWDFFHSIFVQMKVNRRAVTMLYAGVMGKMNGDPVKENNFKNRFHLTLCAKHCTLQHDSRRRNRWWVGKIRKTPWIAITALK